MGCMIFVRVIALFEAGLISRDRGSPDLERLLTFHE